MRSILPLVACSAALAATACAKKLDTPIEQIPALGELELVMQNLEATGGRLWGKSGEDSYSDEEWSALKGDGARILALAERAKSFSRAPAEEFDKYAAQLGTNAQALGAAVDKKDAAAAGRAIDGMKATCKACHAATR